LSRLGCVPALAFAAILGLADWAPVTTAPGSVLPVDSSSLAGAVANPTPGPIAISSPPEATDLPDPTAGVSPTPGPSPAPTPLPVSTCPPPPAGPIAPVVDAGRRSRRVVALTFDDGWSPSNTLKILAILEAARVSATFFPIGRMIGLYPDVWRAVARAGFPIADHTWDHKTLTHLCYDDQLREMARQDAIVRQLLGVTPLAVMRPPGGAWNRTTLLAAAATGQRDVVLWDVDTRDWSDPSPALLASRALAGLPGSIILMHASLDNTPAALPMIIAGYRARGYGFVTIGTLLGIGGPVPYAP
jgi:peptidoglycan/xylan/chitin deacetylase (PgdA/CDA1 family)